VIGPGKRLDRRGPKSGSGNPVEELEAASRFPGPTAKRRAVFCRLDGVASSVTMHTASLSPSSLPDNKIQPVTINSYLKGRPYPCDSINWRLASIVLWASASRILKSSMSTCAPVRSPSGTVTIAVMKPGCF